MNKNLGSFSLVRKLKNIIIGNAFSGGLLQHKVSRTLWNIFRSTVVRTQNCDQAYFEWWGFLQIANRWLQGSFKITTIERLKWLWNALKVNGTSSVFSELNKQNKHKSAINFRLEVKVPEVISSGSWLLVPFKFENCRNATLEASQDTVHTSTFMQKELCKIFVSY